MKLQWRVDDMAIRIMAGFYFVEQNRTRDPINFSSWTTDTFGPEHYYVGSGWSLINEHVDVRAEHSNVIRDIGARSTVLLKNVNGTLPLTGREKLTAVFGNDAGPNLAGPNSCSDRDCDNGTLGMAWGSGSSNFPYLVTPDTAIQNVVVDAGGAYESSMDNYQPATMGLLARRANVSIFFANSDSGEWYIEVDANLGDRNNLTFWQGADAALATVAGNCSNTILVVHSTGPVMLEAYKNHPNITAILWAGVPGEQSGNSIADVLYGRVNPGAKLPFTIGQNRSSYGTDILYTPNNNNSAPQLDFKEGVFIDYRAFDAHNETPTYEFGFGLSYTNFSYTDLRVTKLNVSAYVPFTGYTSPAPTYGNISMDAADHLFPANFSRVPLYQYPWLNSTNLTKASADPDYNLSDYSLPAGVANGSAQPIPAAGGAPGGNPMLYDVLYRVQCTIRNTGAVAGEEVAQLYVSRGGQYDPVRELRGFERLSIQPNGTATFSVDLTRRDLSMWDTGRQDWVLTSATKRVFVGSSSRVLPLMAVLS